MRLVQALIALVMPLALHAQQPAKSIEEFVDAEWPETGAPGVAYAVVDAGEVYTGVRGTRLAGGDDPITADTPFMIGSISKSFTALAIMQMVEAGKLELDGKIGSYLEPFASRPSGSITIRQLLSHTSGFSTVQGNSMHMDAKRAEASITDRAAELALWDLVYAPGERWEYSNANYHVLGAVIEAVSGEDYARYVQAKILTPLGMTNSFVSDGRTPDDAAVPHRPWFGGNRAFPFGPTERVGGPSGGIFASANDLARYLAMMLDGEDTIVSAASKAQMMRPASDASPFYGLGWFLDVEAGTAWHGGLVPGTEALATLSPDTGKGALVLVNANGGMGFSDNQALRKGITARALGLDYAGEGAFFWPKAAYLIIMFLPVAFALSTVWAWLARTKLRAKSGASGKFSLWFPLLSTAAMAVVLIYIVPQMFGGSIGTLILFQPDFGWAMVAAAVLGPLWAIIRLVIAHAGRAPQA